MEIHFEFKDIEAEREKSIMRFYYWASLIISLTLLCCVCLSSCAVTPARADILSIARLEIGHGETFGDNRGVDIKRYLQGRENLPWCAGFVSYCIKQSGGGCPYTLRARDYLSMGKKVHNPKPGDLIVFSRGHGAGHVGIVEKVSGESIVTIEGNTGAFPSKVKRITYKNKPKNLLGYIRLAKSI